MDHQSEALTGDQRMAIVVVELTTFLHRLLDLLFRGHHLDILQVVGSDAIIELATEGRREDEVLRDDAFRGTTEEEWKAFGVRVEAQLRKALGNDHPRLEVGVEEVVAALMDPNGVDPLEPDRDHRAMDQVHLLFERPGTLDQLEVVFAKAMYKRILDLAAGRITAELGVLTIDDEADAILALEDRGFAVLRTRTGVSGRKREDESALWEFGVSLAELQKLVAHGPFNVSKRRGQGEVDESTTSFSML